MERASTVGLRFYLAEALAAISVLKYAKAEAVLGWLNSTKGLPADEPFEAAEFSRRPAEGLREAFRRRGAEITHLKFLIIARGKAMWTSMTQVKAQSSMGGDAWGSVKETMLVLNARVRLYPEELERVVRGVLLRTAEGMRIRAQVTDLQCFSPPYPRPPYRIPEP